MGTLSPAQAQLELDYFCVDTTGLTPKASLPSIYFKAYRGDLLPTSQEDVAYLVHLLEQYPNLHLRLRCDGQLKRFDHQQRRLNRRRMRRLMRILHEEYGINKKRLIPITAEAWNHRSGKDPEPHPLVFRRIRCEAVWVEPKREATPVIEDLGPTEQPSAPSIDKDPAK